MGHAACTSFVTGDSKSGTYCKSENVYAEYRPDDRRFCACLLHRPAVDLRIVTMQRLLGGLRRPSRRLWFHVLHVPLLGKLDNVGLSRFMGIAITLNP